MVELADLINQFFKADFHISDIDREIDIGDAMNRHVLRNRENVRLAGRDSDKDLGENARHIFGLDGQNGLSTTRTRWSKHEIFVFVVEGSRKIDLLASLGN